MALPEGDEDEATDGGDHAGAMRDAAAADVIEVGGEADENGDGARGVNDDEEGDEDEQEVVEDVAHMRMISAGRADWHG